MYIFLNLLIFYDIITLEHINNLYIIIYASKKVNGGYEAQGRLQRINPFKEIDGKEYNKKHNNKQKELLEKFSKEIQQGNKYLEEFSNINDETRLKRAYNNRTDLGLYHHPENKTLYNLVHTDAFTHRRFYKQTPLRRTELYIEQLLHSEACTHRGAFIHRGFHTNIFLHTETFTQKTLYTEELLHTDAFTQRNFYTETFTHSFF